MTDDDDLERRLRRDHAATTAITAGASATGRATAAVVIGALADVVLRRHGVEGGGDVATALASGAIATLDELRRALAAGSAVEAARTLGERAPEIQAHLAKPGAPTDADIAAIIEAFLAACAAQHDRRVRELITNATVNAFDPAKYEEGITGRILGLLARLEVGHIETLRNLDRVRSQPHTDPARRPPETNSMADLYFDELRRNGLAAPERPVSLLGWKPTELGDRLLAHVDHAGSSTRGPSA